MNRADNRSVSLFGLIKAGLMNDLQQRVAELGVCPDGHRKTLDLRYEAEGMRFYQCRECLKIYVLESKA